MSVSVDFYPGYGSVCLLLEMTGDFLLGAGHFRFYSGWCQILLYLKYHRLYSGLVNLLLIYLILFLKVLLEYS